MGYKNSLLNSQELKIGSDFNFYNAYNSQMHNSQKLKNISLKAVTFFSNKNKSNLFEWKCLFSFSYSGVTAIFTAMWVILSERPIT